jgi:hypothetical protein
VQHALAIAQLNLGFAQEALATVGEAMRILDVAQHPDAKELHAHFLLTRAAAAEMTDSPGIAIESYARALELVPDQAQALCGWGQLLLSMGALEEGLTKLKRYLDHVEDIPEAKEAMNELVDALTRWATEAPPTPRVFLDAHRESYRAFFDHHAGQMEEKGWIAEASKMERDPDGGMMLSIDEEARPYAGMRVDLVNPATGQPGMIGEEPMIVALADFEALAHATCCFEWQGHPFGVGVSSQCPWNELPIQIQFESGDAVEQVDDTMGAWYTAGFNGDFGTPTGGRFHFISPPLPHREHGVLYQVDMGRSERAAIDDLLQRLAELHQTHPIRRVLIGRALLPN